MTMIFLGGSRDIYELPAPAIERIGAIVAAEHGVLIYDAPGADAEMKGMLAGYNYEPVGVFHARHEPVHKVMLSMPRKIGKWPAAPISA